MAAPARIKIKQDGATKSALLFPVPPEVSQPEVPVRDQYRLNKHLDAVCKGIKSPATEETVRHVFDALSRLREILRIVELNAGAGGPTRVTLAAFGLAERESRSLIGFIETRAAKTKCIKGPLRETLCGMSFALRHELKIVFGHELAGVAPEQGPFEARPAFTRSHGRLSNCFQQLILTLARVFDPSVKGEFLFDDYRTRFKQSSVLLRELSALSRLVRLAQESPEAEAVNFLSRELKAFRQGTIYYLMARDWGEFENLSCEVMCSRGTARQDFTLHCFASYLETLINQVRMRSVLNDQSPASAQAKPIKKSRKGRR